jgi:hypothetical protein
MYAKVEVEHVQATEERQGWTCFQDCGRCAGKVYQGTAYAEAGQVGVWLLIKSSLVAHVDVEVEVEPSLSV